MTTLTTTAPASTIDHHGAPILAWEPTPGMTFEEYVEAGRQLGAATRVCQFLIGDWANYGEQAYGDKYDQVADVTGYDYGTLRHFASTAARIEPCRRRHALTYGHHREVESLEPDQQDELLERAERDQLTVLTVRNEVKAIRGTAAELNPQDPGDLTPFVAKVRAALRNLADVAGAEREATAVLVRAGNEDDEDSIYVTIDGLIVGETA